VKTFIFKLVLTALIIIALVMNIDVGAVYERLKALPASTILLGLAISLLQIAVLAFRWVRVSQFAGGGLSLRNALHCTFASQLISQGLPASIGGDALRLWWLTRLAIPFPQAVMSILLDRIAGFFALIVLCCVSVALLAGLVIYSEHIVSTAAAIGTIFVLFVFGASRSARRLMLTIYLMFPWDFRRKKSVGAIVRSLLRFQSGTGKLVFSTKGVEILIWSVSIHLATILICYLVANSAKMPVGFLQLVAVVPPVMLLSYLPISIGGWGVREGAMAIALGILGLPVADGVLIGFALGAFSLMAALFGGLLWLAAPASIPLFNRSLGNPAAQPRPVSRGGRPE
jgi:uncharacterized protein (TIRG00374 family)